MNKALANFVISKLDRQKYVTTIDSQQVVSAWFLEREIQQLIIKKEICSVAELAILLKVDPACIQESIDKKLPLDIIQEDQIIYTNEYIARQTNLIEGRIQSSGIERLTDISAYSKLTIMFLMNRILTNIKNIQIDHDWVYTDDWKSRETEALRLQAENISNPTNLSVFGDKPEALMIEAIKESGKVVGNHFIPFNWTRKQTSKVKNLLLQAESGQVIQMYELDALQIEYTTLLKQHPDCVQLTDCIVSKSRLAEIIDQVNHLSSSCIVDLEVLMTSNPEISWGVRYFGRQYSIHSRSN